MTKFTRRSFMGTLSGGTILLNAAQATKVAAGTSAANLKIKYFCPRWGAGDTWEVFCKRVKEAGYDGVEAAVSANPAERREMKAALDKYKLELIIQALPNWPDFAQHKKGYEALLHDLVTLKPLFINSQTGKDFFTFAQNQQILAVAQKIAQESEVKILHETHRGKWSFAAHTTKLFLEKIPDLRLTLDISHWCNVAESLLENQTAAVDLALNHTDHIHARIGHPEGPQVNDPRAPEWDNALKAHLNWWDKIVNRHKQDNSAFLTITPEFGPPTYLPTLPYTQQPVTNQWEVNVHMMTLLKKRYT